MMNDTDTRFEDALRRDLRRLGDRAGEGPTPEQVLEDWRSRPSRGGARASGARFRALAAAVIGAVLVGLLLLWLGLGRGGAGIAWAEVRDEILSAQTASWNVRIEMKGTDPVTYRVFSKEPGLMRQEMPGGLVVIVDVSQGMGISLDSERKTALVMDMKDFLADAVAGKGPNLSLAWFKELVKGGHEELGEEEIDGIKVRGFRLGRDGISGGTTDMWVDPATGYIVRSDFEVAEQGLRVRTTDFELNPPLDDALFSTEVPEGYEVETSGIDFGGAGEKDLVAGLRYLAEHNKGVFPKVLMDPLNMPSRRQMNLDMAAMDRERAEREREMARVNREMADSLVEEIRGYQAEKAMSDDEETRELIKQLKDSHNSEILKWIQIAMEKTGEAGDKQIDESRERHLRDLDARIERETHPVHRKELEDQRKRAEKTDGIMRRARQAKSEREIADSLIEQIHQFQEQEAMSDDEETRELIKQLKDPHNSEISKWISTALTKISEALKKQVEGHTVRHLKELDAHIERVNDPAHTKELEEHRKELVERVEKEALQKKNADKPAPAPPPAASRAAERSPAIVGEEMFSTEMQFMMAVGTITVKSDEFEYFGGGVKLGDAGTAIMWWRIKGAQTYRVVYGDLTVKDIDPSDLPAKRRVSDD